MTAIFLVLLIGTFGTGPAPQLDLSLGSQQTTDYQLGPGDLLSIHVSGVREFDQSTRVSNSGRIHVPYVGIMFVSGKTPLQLEQDIARLIREHELVNEPSVRVQIDQHRSQPAYVIGEVMAPGQFAITDELYVLDLISKAGGLLASADETGLLYRRHSAQPGVESRLVGSSDRPAAAVESPAQAVRQENRSALGDDPATETVIRINLKELREGTKPEMNLQLQGGDILYVPRLRPEAIYVIGDVKVPGAYGLPRRGQITAAQAIIYAGGPLATAKMGNGFLMRHDEAGNRQAIPVDFAAIIDGRRPDIPVRPNDIIFVPNSNIKTIGVGLLNLVPRLIQQFIIF